MGRASRTRAEQWFREEDALQRQIDALETLTRVEGHG
jgi:hypothetical protein